ncbi:hypothetical protein D3C86_1812100 [compost metagenome]
MLLLFIPEFTPQQLRRLVGDLSQPLFEGLALFTVQGAGAGIGRWAGGLLVVTLAGARLCGGV